MGGRPQVLGLLALAVAVWFASPVVAPPAAAEIRVPLPGVDAKKKVKRKRHARPTMPRRNPTRATAGLSASAVSPPQAKNREVATAAGATSSATVSLALPPKPEQRAETEQQTKTAAVDTDATTENAEAEAPAPSAVEEAKEQIDEGADAPEAADAETAADDAKEEIVNETAEAARESASEAAEAAEETAESAAETVETATDAATDNAEQAAEDTAPSSETDEAVEQTAATDADATAATDDEKTAEADAAPAPSKDNEDAQENAENESVDLKPADPKPADPEPETAATETKEEDGPPKPAEVADQSEDTPAPAEDAAADASAAKDTESETVPTETAALPDHDATVVLDVAPPPDDISSTEDTKPATGSGEKDVAVLTPPSTPDKMTPDSDAKANETAEPNSAPTDADSEETTADGDADAVDGEAEAEDEVVAEPAPPPAHPVVAEIREKLQDPALAKTVAASDLEALKAFYGTHEGPPLWVTEDAFTTNAQGVIAEIGKADDWGLTASSFKLPSTNDPLTTPDALADAELQLSIATLGYARDAQIGRLTPKRVSKLFDQRPSLRDPASVLKETAAASDPSAYLVSLHPQHDQFKKLQKALLNARQSAKATGRDPATDQNVQLITINMERWRWLPRNLGNYHVWNNVPEFQVQVRKDGRTIYQGKTIVGQLKYATPFFSAKMRNIVFHPNWTVPPTIVKEDIAPKLQGTGGGFFGASKEATLRRYGLKANYKGKPINADTVDWKNVNVHAYTFVQDPGPANVLGKFKFNFPNKHAIYMHDTVQPELFSQRMRTLSHGCIRVHQPAQLATLLLGQDKGWSAGNVHSLVARNESKVIALKRHVPVHLTYFTAIVDEYGNLSKPGDIYGIDNLMAPKLFRSPAAFPVPPPAVVAESSPSRTQQRRSQRRRGGGEFNNFISGLFGN